MSPTNLLRLILLAALWGSSFLFMRMVAPVLGAVPTAFGRVVLAAVGLLALLLVMRTTIAFKDKFTSILLLGAVNSGIPFLMFALAARVLPAGYSAILNATTPLMGVIIGVLVFGERANPLKWAGVVVGIGGVVVLSRIGSASMTPAIMGGVAACLVAAVCYGFGGFLTKRWVTLRGGLDSRIVAMGSQFGAILFLLPFALWDGIAHPLAWSTLELRVVSCVVALGLLCTALAYVLYFKLIAEVGPVKASTVTFLIPLFGVFWGWLILNESLSSAHLWGGGLIAIALALVLRPESVGQKDANKEAKKEV